MPDPARPGDGTLFGPAIRDGATTFRLWAPSADAVAIVIEGRDPSPMTRAEDGFHSTTIAGVGEGARYRFRIGDRDVPDPASRQQDGDTRGWSVVRAPLSPSPRGEPIRPWHETVICEVHIGTATPEGTFDGLRQRLEHFRDAGYTCLEIMPINEFPGARNWGYDGTLIFAPDSTYGTPDALRALVDRAHELGLCMIQDVVYNHFGETDNFLADYAPEWFDDAHESPWGPRVDFDKGPVRRFYIENACMWLTEFDFDGLRIDAIHEIKGNSSDLFLSELAQACRAAKPHAKLIVENIENQATWLERCVETNEPVNFTAQWNDDMHHVLTAIVAPEDAKRTGYDDPGKDPYADLEKALADGFVHDREEGEDSDGRTRGGPASRLPPDSFVTYIENHDQIGNRSDGTRLSNRIEPRRLDFAHFIKFLAPQIPLCFMGDEANLTSPFPFFVDLPPDAAAAKRDDRYRQMQEIFDDPVEEGGLPDPNDPATFEAAKLPWPDFGKEGHRAALDRFRTLGGYRREHVWPLAATPCLDARSARQGNCLIVTWEFEAGVLSMALNPTDVAMDIVCAIGGLPVSTGEFCQHGEVLRLGPWSAVAWSERKVT